MDFVLSVWREACRHIDIDESIERIARLLPSRLPADALIVRAFNVTEHRINTVAVGLTRGGPPIVPRHREVTAEQMNGLLAWCRRGELAHGTPESRDALLRLLVPIESGEWIVGPLRRDTEPIGALVLFARPPHRFDDAAWVGYRLTEILPVPLIAKQKLLELNDPIVRLEILHRFLEQRGLLTSG